MANTMNRDSTPCRSRQSGASFRLFCLLAFFVSILAGTQLSASSAYLVKDINQNPGPAKSLSPGNITAAGAQTFFVGRDPVHGWELWKTDGSPSGASLVMDIYPGPWHSNIDQPVLFNGAIYFRGHRRC